MNATVWMQALAVALGSIVGGLARWRVSVWLNPSTPSLPLGTLVVNCVGGLLIGAVLEALSRHPNDLLRLLLVTGFMGGLTTFSSFTAESLGLLEQGKWMEAGLHSLAHVFGALACAAIGARLVRLALA